MAAPRRRLLSAMMTMSLAGCPSQHLTFPSSSATRRHSDGHGPAHTWASAKHQCSGEGTFGISCLFDNLVLWQKHFYYISTENVSIPDVTEGWYLPWHKYGSAKFSEHVTVVSPHGLPWAEHSETEYIEEALVYHWLDIPNMYHLMMETGNFIFATACKLLGACTHSTSHYQILATGYFKYGEDQGLPAGHESLHCLSSQVPRWVGDPVYADKVVIIGKTAIGIGAPCETSDIQCEWDAVQYMQNKYTSGHRKLLLDCLNLEDQVTEPSQRNSQVTVVQRPIQKGRSILNVLEVQDVISDTGAQVQIVNMEGKTLRQQAEILTYTHVYIHIHGAALALYLFLPTGAAMIEIQHSYAHSAIFPSSLQHRTVAKYDMDYYHQTMIAPRPEDMVLQREKVLEDEVYRNNMTTTDQMALWEQGRCPGNDDELTQHCVKYWIFLAGNMIIDLDQLKTYYHRAWQSLPP